MAVALKYVLYFKVQLKVRVRLGEDIKMYLQQTYFKNVLKDGFIDPIICGIFWLTRG